eukprot:5280309-Karenia_brevis.AAC.1
MTQSTATNTFAKVSLLTHRLMSYGPPVHIALSWAGPPAQQSAICCFLCGDMGLGRYAANYFAKSPLPRSAQH